MTNAKKPGTPEAWESGELGESLESAKIASAETTKQIQEAAGMQLISIRLPKSVIEEFKVIAQIEGIGYQPLMREALMRFAECEAKRLMRDYAAKLESEKKSALTPAKAPRPARKTAPAAAQEPKRLAA